MDCPSEVTFISFIPCVSGRIVDLSIIMLTIIEHSIVLILAEFNVSFFVAHEIQNQKFKNILNMGRNIKKTTVFGGFIGAVDGI